MPISYPGLFLALKWWAGIKTPAQDCQNTLKKNPGMFCHVKMMKCLFHLNNDFRLSENEHHYLSLEKTSKIPFHCMSSDKILHDSWSILAALLRDFQAFPAILNMEMVLGTSLG